MDLDHNTNHDDDVVVVEHRSTNHLEIDEFIFTHSISSSIALRKAKELAGPSYKSDINKIDKILVSVQNMSPFHLSTFSTKIEELRKPLIEYYRIKYICMKSNSNSISKSQNDKLHSLFKLVDKYTTYLLRAFEEHLKQLRNEVSYTIHKKNEFIHKFSKLMIDIFSIDYLPHFISPLPISAIWKSILDWISKMNVNVHNRNTSTILMNNNKSFQFDFHEDRIWLIKSICSLQNDLLYIVLLYDSGKNDAKGFSKCKSKQGIKGVKISAHTHGLMYGRRAFESIICDLCEKDWNGSSWHCTLGCDFDTCHDCFASYLQRKQLYRSIIYIRANYDNLKILKLKNNLSISQNATVSSEIFYDDIRNLQRRSSVLLSMIHQYLFYSYPSYVHIRIMDLLQIILRVINPLQIQSLCKDIQLALFQLFNPYDLNNLHKKIEISLKFPHYIQTSFWLLLSAALRSTTNSDEIFIKNIKYLIKLKEKYISKKDGIEIWITPQCMNGILDWTQYIYKSKHIEDIYESLLSFPISIGFATGLATASVSASVSAANQNNYKNKKIKNSLNFDEFHIQSLIHLLSLKSPRWKIWLESKLKILKNKYQQRQVEHEEVENAANWNDDTFISLNKSRRKRNKLEDEIFQCTVSLDEKDSIFLTNLLKFYEYLTFVEPNINNSSVSIMANTYLYDANQRNILVEFFNQFSKLSDYLSRLKEFWPPESSKNLSNSSLLGSSAGVNGNSTQQRIQSLSNINSHLNNSNNTKTKNKYTYNNFEDAVSSNSDDISAVQSEDDDLSQSHQHHNTNNNQKKKKKKKKKDKKDKKDKRKNKHKNNILLSPTSTPTKHKNKKSFIDDSSISKSAKINKKNSKKYRSLNATNPQSPKSLIKSNGSSLGAGLGLGLIPKRRDNSMSIMNHKKRNRNVNSNSNSNSNQPPTKKRKINQSSNNNNNNNNNLSLSSSPISSIRRAQSEQTYSSNDRDRHHTHSTYRYEQHHHSLDKEKEKEMRDRDNYNKLKKIKNLSKNTEIVKSRSPLKRRKNRQINDSSDEEDGQHTNYGNNGNKNLHKNKNKNKNKEKDKDNNNNRIQTVSKSPTRSESLEYDDDEYDELEEDSLANRYTKGYSKKDESKSKNNDNEMSEDWLN